MNAKPWNLIKVAKLFAEQHALMHECIVVGLPSQIQHLEENILSAQALSTRQKEYAINILRRLSAEKRLCHGDFHPYNVIMSSHGPKTIDWSTALQGHPLADVARTSLILQLGVLLPGTPVIAQVKANIARRFFHDVYIKRYFELSQFDQRELAAWKLPIIAGEFGNGILEEDALLGLFLQYTDV
uniref:Phosphotransferase enzyme family protein n=1 Tax=Candidatus Kentrum eta TaxID=2126337 RepID=A0A450VIR0_9GAMM|nr:MAG: Phosphotransferase enzyme family protein [Candidatus Kentron sp. H]VFK02179.1 MAG: Phosphotransferase enzyme family protein [Candidatus Kentron sp. H]VFK04620.1 MAG: Phosphotransferase enzyme family protein [Candidatus Kentron sp. H]